LADVAENNPLPQENWPTSNLKSGVAEHLLVAFLNDGAASAKLAKEYYKSRQTDVNGGHESLKKRVHDLPIILILTSS
jgi:hypothetical protein